jgi:hypothetical protein
MAADYWKWLKKPFLPLFAAICEICGVQVAGNSDQGTMKILPV